MVKHLSPGVVLSVVLWGAVGAAAYAFVASRHAPAQRQLVHAVGTASLFSHVYPPDPAPYERPAVGTGSPVVPVVDRLPTRSTITSIAQLSAVVGRGTLRKIAPRTWVLTQPVELAASTALELQGPLTVEIGPNAFVLAEHGALLELSGVTVTGVEHDLSPATVPSTGRGYIDVRDGARATLRGDTFTDLGHLGDQSYGITLDNASERSAVIGCTVRHDYFGIYLSKLSGGQIVGNRVIDSLIYGIDPHTFDSNLVIKDNVVIGSGVHGIVLADHASHNQVTGNLVESSRDHGILVFQFSDHNLIENNTVVRTFDGIVIQDSSQNRLIDNKVGPVSRFGLRISGLATGNYVTNNTLTGAVLGAYLYQGASGNQLIGNIFRTNYENVRVRSDATGNKVTPDPGRSEL
jgi:parallel beta-helix repeat protein